MANNPNNNSPSPSGKGSRKRDFIVGNALIFTATLFWALNVPADKYMVPTWISGVQLGVMRIVGAGVLVWLTSLFVRCERIQRGDWGRLAICGVALAGFILLLSMSFRYTSPVDISIILTLPPMMVLLMRWWFMHVKSTGREIIGMLIALAGAVFLILMASGEGRGNEHLTGDLMTLASCACYAVYLVLIEKPARSYKPINLTRWVYVTAVICCLPLLYWLPEQPVFHRAEAAPIIILALIVLLPSYAAYLLVPPSIKRIGSDLESMYQYLLPIIATIASIALGLAEFRWYQPVALVVILGGVFLANRAKLKSNKNT